MPKDRFEQDDPLELVGVALPAEGPDTTIEMGRCFMEEFLRMGWSQARILKTFSNPFFRGPFLVHRCLGDEGVKGLLAETVARLRRPRPDDTTLTSGQA